MIGNMTGKKVRGKLWVVLLNKRTLVGIVRFNLYITSADNLLGQNKSQWKGLFSIIKYFNRVVQTRNKYIKDNCRRKLIT